MIIEKKCKVCNLVLKANGMFQFEDKVKFHYFTFHSLEWDKIKEEKKKARLELDKLKLKYPHLYIDMGNFRISVYTLTEEQK